MGKKLTLYHATNPDAEKEILKKGFDKTKSTANLFGDGIYLSEDKEFTKSFGKKILKVEAEVENPFTFKNKEENELWNKLTEEGKEKEKVFPSNYAGNKIDKMNYDSIRTQEYDARDNKTIKNWVLFNKKSIKRIKPISVSQHKRNGRNVRNYTRRKPRKRR